MTPFEASSRRVRRNTERTSGGGYERPPHLLQLGLHAPQGRPSAFCSLGRRPALAQSHPAPAVHTSSTAPRSSALPANVFEEHHVQKPMFTRHPDGEQYILTLSSIVLICGSAQCHGSGLHAASDACHGHKNPPITPKEIAEHLSNGVTSEMVNSALEQLGFQVKKHRETPKGQPRSKWILTEASKVFGAMAPNQAEKQQHTGHRVGWYVKVIELIQPMVEVAIAQRAAAKAAKRPKKVATPIAEPQGALL